MNDPTKEKPEGAVLEWMVASMEIYKSPLGTILVSSDKQKVYWHRVYSIRNGSAGWLVVRSVVCPTNAPSSAHSGWTFRNYFHAWAYYQRLVQYRHDQSKRHKELSQAET